jgi:RND family efflux transporter MFP subunit
MKLVNSLCQKILEKIPNKLHRKKWLSICIAVAAVAVSVGGFLLNRNRITDANAEASEEAAMQTAKAWRGDLVITASGTGQLAPASQISMGFDESGTLIELKVNIGDEVKAGDVLARLQTQNSPEEIAASIADAELVVIQAQQALDNLYANAETTRTEAMNDIATYAQEVRDAQYELENYIMPVFMQGMDAIQAVDQTKAQLDAASAAFEPYRLYPATDETRHTLLVALNEAQSSHNAAVKLLDYEYVLQVAQDNLDKARQEYEQYENGPAGDELTEAQTELDNSKAKLEIAKTSQSVIDLKAPMDGTVMAMDANMGEVIETASFITLADLSQLEIEVYLDETDLDKAVVGNQAEMVFDALPDQVFTGKLIQVSPGLETISNVQAVKVIVLLDETNTDIKLPVGLNASVDVIAGQAQNAVLVPIEALRELDEGEYGVFVVENDQPVLREVQVGLMDITSAEIISGLEAGETVTTGIIQTN